LEDLGLDGRITLILNLKELAGECGLDSSGSRQGREAEFVNTDEYK
jgi:hypothetical protein